MTTGPEIFCNAAETALGAGYTTGAGSITVASSTAYGAVAGSIVPYGTFPNALAAGQFFRIKCGAVLMKVTAVNTATNVWTVTVVESNDANQGTNIPVTARLTAGGVANLTQSGSITDSDISASAAIAPSKLAIPDAGTATLGLVEIDTPPASGHPIALTEAGTALPAGMLASATPEPTGTAATGTAATAARADHVHATSLAAGADVALSGPTLGQQLTYDGTKWTNTNPTASGGASSPLTNPNAPDLIFDNTGDVITTFRA